MPLSSIVAAVGKNSTSAGTMAIAPLVLTSAAITGYARHVSSHALDAKNSHAIQELEHEREEHLHQHVALPWKGTRHSGSHKMLAPRKTLHSTPLRVFRRALELVQVQSSDVLYDLGCGDGRLVIEAAKTFGVRAVGVEIDPKRAQEARDAAVRAGVDHLVTVHEANALEFDIPSDATIVFLFLITRGLSLVRPKLDKLQCRVITYLYRIPDLSTYERHFVPAKEDSDSLVATQDVAFPVYIYHFPIAECPPMSADQK
ncbi:hypothetical protein PHYBOEH_000855 [Phytophthora boehmeriae]|uniref:Methyltransferase domain-containing protein n=1 Tax=Phytophthora boehmeriae TaxID=109152 RepID=A0A8T1X009_9STRA|nr:hypothetical protein PHYBOEH_000855 [Phytophthora boehmeriae]